MIVTLQVDAQAEAIDPAATHTLQQMTDYFGSLRQCGLHTQNTREDLLDSGQRVDLDISGNVIVSRPNMLGAERKGVLLDQAFHYDGKSLALHSPTEKVVVTEPCTRHDRGEARLQTRVTGGSSGRRPDLPYCSWCSGITREDIKVREA